MKRNKGMFFTGLVTGILIVVLAIVVIVPKQTFIVKESKLNFKETVEAIEKSAAEQKWGIPHQYDLQATLKSKGLDVSPVKILSLCKPEYAYEILSRNEERLASSLMPCRIAVYEKEGKTYVSMLNAELFSKLLSKKIKDVMGDASKENKLILAPFIIN